MHNKMTKLISAFPGTGKSHYFKTSLLKGLDSDSSTFDKTKFPHNYITHIKNNIGKTDYILISSHKTVRDALVENNLHFILVYPEKSLKDEYVKRYRERGSSEQFITLLINNWDDWIDELDNQKNCDRIVLNSGEYLSDYFL